MKTYKNLYPDIYNFGNLYAAYRKACQGKRSRVEAAVFEFDLEHNLLALQNELLGRVLWNFAGSRCWNPQLVGGVT